MNEKFLAQRILVIGSSGAGKSSLSTALGKILGIDVIHLDRHFYQPGWKSLPPDRWREDVARLVATDRWIMDGDFSDTFDLRFPRADAVIDLAYGRYRCIFQAMKRLAFALPEGRKDLPVGCRESFDASNLKWIWSYPITNRPRIDEAVKKWGSHLLYLKFTSPRQLRRWLEDTISC
jgi:adenylate kinase family enzyme